MAAFRRLSRARGAGVDGPSAISITDLYSYLLLVGEEEVSRTNFVDVIQTMDKVFLEHSKTQAAAARTSK